ncbi:MAG: Stk1 family PASTA domain-containing Ser/Thr kinase [Solirubrobacterales bacterium]
MTEVAEGTVVVGRYRVLQRIGSGGMADVWLAEDTHLRRRVALKVLHKRFAQDREFVERFRREAEAAASLQHPNIVAVFDRGAIDDTYFIAMQFVEGRSMKELIDAGLTPPQASAMVIQILEAAKFAHRHNVIHRDLKPQNVIVDSEGRARVTDFGIVRAGVSEITQTGSVMGTAHYLSPEQAQGLEVTAASDLYSVGVILYEALTRRVPFEGESAVAVALKQVSQAPQRPSALNPAVSPAMDAVVMRALEKDPSRRFHDADAFIAALRAAERDRGAAGDGTASFSPLPPVVVLPPEEAAADQAEDGDEDAKRRRRRWIVVAAAVLLGVLAGLALTRDTTTEVPKVTNELEVDAKTQLENAGFKVDVVARVHRAVPAHRVLEQDPLASPPADQAALDCGFLTFFCSKPTVHLTVSAGPGQATVPDLRGLPRSEARQKLENRGFEVAFVSASSGSVPAGNVISTDPIGGSDARVGALVTVTVSSGPRLVTVPAVVGRSSDAAKQAIAGRGLNYSVTFQQSQKPAGKVLSQSPDAGTRVAVGDTVSIVVSEGVQKVSVPNVIGDLRSTAVSKLRGAGFAVAVNLQDTSVPAQDGRVTDQFPAPGSKLAKGDEVTIFVGKLTESPTTPTTPIGP